MATTDNTGTANTGTGPATAGQRWYALDPADVAGRLSVDVDAGLSAAEAAQRLHGTAAHGTHPWGDWSLAFRDGLTRWRSVGSGYLTGSRSAG